MPKITSEVARAVRNATRLIPCSDCPCPKAAEVVAALEEVVGEAVVVVEDMMESLWGFIGIIET
jgi:hypothetical protein